MSLATRLPLEAPLESSPIVAGVPRAVLKGVDTSLSRPVLAEVRRRLAETAGTSALSEGQLRVKVESELAAVLADPEFTVPADRRDEVRRSVLDEILGFGILQELLDDPAISEIMVNGASTIFVESHGVVSKLPRAFDSEEQLLAVINRMVRSTGRRVDQTSPMVDARLPDGSRLNAVLPPLAVDGASVTIRKFTANHLTVDRLIEVGSLSTEAAELIQIAVEQRINQGQQSRSQHHRKQKCWQRSKSDKPADRRHQFRIPGADQAARVQQRRQRQGGQRTEERFT